jgi:hypothetical protein
MSIITWTLPTQLIPYLGERVKNEFNIENELYDVAITTLISLLFILIEGILIYFVIDKNLLFSNNKYIEKFKFMF